jgi:hypothetical protein
LSHCSNLWFPTSYFDNFSQPAGRDMPHINYLPPVTRSTAMDRMAWLGHPLCNNPSIRSDIGHCHATDVDLVNASTDHQLGEFSITSTPTRRGIRFADIYIYDLEKDNVRGSSPTHGPSSETFGDRRSALTTWFSRTFTEPQAR